MEAQALVELLEKLIDRKLERLQAVDKAGGLRGAEVDREIQQVKKQMIELLQPLFT